MGQGVAAATKEGGKRGQRVTAVSSQVVVVAKGWKGQGVAAATTKQGGERKRGQSRAAASSSPMPVVGGRSEMILAPVGERRRQGDIAALILCRHRQTGDVQQDRSAAVILT
jgi:hypothetical protein